jgi:hypothetical protein
MSISLVCFATKEYERNRNILIFTAKNFAKIKNVFSFYPKDIPKEISNNLIYANLKKGFGNYFWKSYFIIESLNKINYGDFIFYSDAGNFFVRNIQPLISKMKLLDKDIFVFELPFVEKQWTKRDAFVKLNVDNIKFTDSRQILSGYFIIRKSHFTMSFFQDFYLNSLDHRIISDLPNELGYKNYDNFIEHRHDQSLLSLLVKKDLSNRILIHNDISDYGFLPIRYFYFHKNFINLGKRYIENDFRFPFILSNRTTSPLMHILKSFFFILVHLFSKKNILKN